MMIASVRLTSAAWKRKRQMLIRKSDSESVMRILLYVVIALPLAFLGVVSAVLALIALSLGARRAGALRL
jgi:hypothetical protein